MNFIQEINIDGSYNLTPNTANHQVTAQIGVLVELNAKNFRLVLLNTTEWYGNTLDQIDPCTHSPIYRTKFCFYFHRILFVPFYNSTLSRLFIRIQFDFN